MVDVRSEVKDVRIERRAHPRLELHCRATVPGLKGLQTLTDISLGGCFIQAKIPGKVKIGQLITFKTKLPTERSEITVRARVVNQTQRGIGCQFIALQEETKDAICLCFEMFKDTLPVGAQREQWAKECSPKAPESPALKSEPAASAPPKPPAPKSRAPKPPSPESPAPASIRPAKTSIPGEALDIKQIRIAKPKASHRRLLTGVAGLAAVVLIGYLLAVTLLRSPAAPPPAPDTRQAAVAVPQRHVVKAQAPAAEPAAEGVDVAVQPLQEAPLEAEAAADVPVKALCSIEISPIFSAETLEKAAGILRDHGCEYEKTADMGSVEAIRLFEGSYPREQARKRLKEIQKVAASAFVIPEKGSFSIYVATYHDRQKAIEKSEQLAGQGIEVTTVPAEIKMKCTKLVVRQVEASTVPEIRERMSTIGLSLELRPSG